MEFPHWISLDKVLNIFRGNSSHAGRRIAAIGMFDGVHTGHRCLIEFLKQEGEKRGLLPTAVTFEAHPLTIVDPSRAPYMLGTLQQKMKWLREAGIEDCVLLPFSEKLRHLTAQQFLMRLKKEYAVDALVVGFNNRMGNDCVGDIEQLQRIGARLGMEILQAPELDNRGESISSSYIRRLIAAGELNESRKALGRNYAIEGKVVEGKKLGRRLGYPTANLQPVEPDQQLPPVGVYAVMVNMGNTRYAGMVNIGYRPTIDSGNKELSIEVNIFDFLGYIYGETIEIEFVAHLRQEKRFNTIEKLKSALAADEQVARKVLQQHNAI